MKDKYTFEAHGVIWRVMYDHTLKTIVLEMRDGDLKEVSFAAIELESGTVLWEGLQLDENWWVSMAGVKNGMLYFSEFEKDNAIPKIKKLQKLDIRTATLVEDNTDDPNDLLSAENFQLPIVYTNESEHHATLVSFLKQLNFKVDTADIHYFETTNEIIFVFNENKNGVLQRNLLICDRDGKVIFQEVIDSVIHNQIMDSFFIAENVLLYIKEKKLWCGISLSVSK